MSMPRSQGRWLQKTGVPEADVGLPRAEVGSGVFGCGAKGPRAGRGPWVSVSMATGGRGLGPASACRWPQDRGSPGADAGPAAGGCSGACRPWAGPGAETVGSELTQSLSPGPSRQPLAVPLRPAPPGFGSHFEHGLRLRLRLRPLA